MSLLSKDEIISENIVRYGRPKSYTTHSYNLRIGGIVDPETCKVVDRLELPPRGAALVITAEELHIPEGILGYTMVKNSRSIDGLLALNTGIVDPNWNRPISTVLINFGLGTRLLTKDQEILRMTFHRGPSVDNPLPPFSTGNREEYELQRTKAFKEKVGNSFLNLDANQFREIFGSIIWNWFKGSLIPILTFIGIIASIVFGLNSLTNSKEQINSRGEQTIEESLQISQAKQSEILTTLSHEVTKLKIELDGIKDMQERKDLTEEGSEE